VAGDADALLIEESGRRHAPSDTKITYDEGQRGSDGRRALGRDSNPLTLLNFHGLELSKAAGISCGEHSANPALATDCG